MRRKATNMPRFRAALVGADNDMKSRSRRGISRHGRHSRLPPAARAAMKRSTTIAPTPARQVTRVRLETPTRFAYWAIGPRRPKLDAEITISSAPRELEEGRGGIGRTG